jgi:hypothetical protein
MSKTILSRAFGIKLYPFSLYFLYYYLPTTYYYSGSDTDTHRQKQTEIRELQVSSKSVSQLPLSA